MSLTTQSEQVLEDNLVKQLETLGYSYVSIKNEKDLIANLKKQVEKHNNIVLSDIDFSKVLNHLNKGNVFEKAKILRDKMQLTKEHGQNIYIEFIQQEHWCQNQFQVTQQVKMEGTYKNRYDVTLLINGLPLVQIELKRRGLELKEAFNQINRYQRHSFSAENGLYNFPLKMQHLLNLKYRLSGFFRLLVKYLQCFTNKYFTKMQQFNRIN